MLILLEESRFVFHIPARFLVLTFDLQCWQRYELICAKFNIKPAFTTEISAVSTPNSCVANVRPRKRLHVTAKHLHIVITLFQTEHDAHTFPDPDIVLDSLFSSG